MAPWPAARESQSGRQSCCNSTKSVEESHLRTHPRQEESWKMDSVSRAKKQRLTNLGHNAVYILLRIPTPDLRHSMHPPPRCTKRDLLSRVKQRCEVMIHVLCMRSPQKLELGCGRRMQKPHKLLGPIRGCVKYWAGLQRSIDPIGWLDQEPNFVLQRPVCGGFLEGLS